MGGGAGPDCNNSTDPAAAASPMDVMTTTNRNENYRPAAAMRSSSDRAETALVEENGHAAAARPTPQSRDAAVAADTTPASVARRNDGEYGEGEAAANGDAAAIVKEEPCQEPAAANAALRKRTFIQRLSSGGLSSGEISTAAADASRRTGGDDDGSLLRRSPGNRVSSLELRKVPDHIVLGPDWNAAEVNAASQSRGLGTLDEELSDDEGDFVDEGEEGVRNGLLQKTCLRPWFSLRTQLMLSFGVVSTLTVLFVMIIAVIVSVSAGRSVERASQVNLEGWAQEKASSGARYVSEAFAPMLPGDVSDILRQVVRDRFVGYPDAAGYATDAHVPFPDMEGGGNKYPIDAPPLPLDWQIGRGNVNGTNFREHVGDRWSWYGSPDSIVLSTKGAFITMQGACDPSVTDPGHKNYRSNCTEASNDVSTGGTVAPNPTFASVHAKGKDLSPVLKALYESAPIVKSLGVSFTSGGAGASIIYPHLEVDGTMSFTSIGCDWMQAENPLKPGEPIGTEEEIARCHADGDDVLVREFNALERGWFRDMALDPNRVHFVGPYLDAMSDRLWLMTVGQAVYDRRTNKFMGCAHMDISVNNMAEMLESVKIGQSSLITLVKWDEEGTVMSSPNWDSDAAEDVTTVDDPELHVGLSSDDFAILKNLIDFSAPWEPDVVRAAYTDKVLRRGSKMVSSYPVPPLPPLYDASYRPDFMVVVTLDTNDVYQSFYDLGETIDDKVSSLIIFTLILGLAGLGGIFGIIFAVSIFLTRPLRWMKDASDGIIGNFGNNGALAESTEDGMEGSFLGEHREQQQQQANGKGIGAATGKVQNEDPTCKAVQVIYNSGTPHLRCAPKTELSDLTHEFQKMVAQFNSDGTAAKAARGASRLTDVRNHFALWTEFDDLYKSRREAGFKYNYRDEAAGGAMAAANSNARKEYTSTSRSVSFGAPNRVHFGPNIHASEDESRSISTHALLTNNDGPVVKSRLFLWVVGLLVTPLLAVTVSIAAVVTWEISNHFTDLDVIVRDEFMELESQAATTAAGLRAVHASQVIQKASKELHLLSRFTGWLLFDGLNRSDSFTSLHTAAEKCKSAGGRGKCEEHFTSVCDCAWNDINANDTCVRFPEGNDTRYLQQMLFEGQSQDAWPNGDRNFTPAKFEATSPQNTSFWDDPLLLPGHERGSAARGYETTYDRVRVASATTVIQLPLYNYDSSDDKPLSINLGFDADGMIFGYGGCGTGHADMAYWKSSESNGAAELRPDLCPLGRNGYDVRCRDWYHNGKKVAVSEKAPIYVTSPYYFASGILVGQSATLPLEDSRSGKFVGMALIDFMSTATFAAVESTQLVAGGFPVLITSRADVLKHDTVIGPNFTLGSDAARVEEVVVPYDWSCSSSNSSMCSSGTRFDNIAEAMRQGENGSSYFVRTTKNGDKEKMHISYAPVRVTSYRPLNHSDFARGIESFSSLVYSLAFVQPEKQLLAPFADDAEEIQRKVNISIGVLSAVIVLASAFLIYISARVTMSITVPILHLLNMIRNVNRLENKEDFTPPTDSSGSSEVTAVYDTLSMLFKVIRFANAAFFSGDIEKAYFVLTDALRLFRSLDNKKAIGVASNNLGICMLVMYRTMETTGESQICFLSKADIIAKGTSYFRDAIKLGEEAYDKFYEEQGWSGSCLVFMQHLSSRYFNRAIFFLTVRKDHKYPDEANRLGFRDLDISKNMDVEVADQCLEVGFCVNKTGLFELMLSRLRGVLSLMEMDYPDEWGIEEQIRDALRELKRELKNPTSNFFSEVSPAGRMQALDAELIKHAQLAGMTEEAAQIGIRMLVEDEYTFHHAQLSAVKALVDYVAAEGGGNSFGSEVKQAIGAFQEEIEAEFMDEIMNRISDVQRSEENMLSSLKSREKHTLPVSTDSRLSLSVTQTCRGDFTMEVF